MQTSKEALIETALRRGEGYNAIAKELRVSAKTIAKVAKRMNEVSPRQALEMFENGISPMEIVKRYDADPKTVAEWCEAWVNMNESWAAGRDYVKKEKASRHGNDGEEHEESKEAKVEGFEKFLREGSKRR